MGAYSAALICAVLVSWGGVSIAFDPPYFHALLAGWGLALLSAATGLAIKCAGTGRGMTRFFVWSLGVNGLRLVILFGIIVAVHRSGMAPFGPFIFATFTGYFCCLICEILVLHFHALGEPLRP